ncbi:MAG: nickel-dependent lactate racemase [Caldiserica bacterium]|nr:MAG: nickel-dependent lactate racemase [Caldisericota bacterium]
MDRPTPTAEILDYIFPIIKESKIKVIIASGSHRKPNECELKVIFGNYYEFFKDKIIFHDAKDERSLKYLGKTKRGTEIFMNKIIFDFDKILVIGSIEPHYFAGFTGGRKAFLPGVSGYKTIEMNHKLALEDGALPLKLRGNPVHEDMEDAINFIDRKNVISFQVIYVPEKGIVDTSCGDIIDSFYTLIPVAEKIFSYKLKEKADILITKATPPLSRTLYQSHKAIENCVQGLKKGGIIILIAECEEGIGGKVFFEHIRSKTPDEVLEEVKSNFKLGFQKSGRFARVLKEYEVFVVSEIEGSLFGKSGIRVYKNVKDAVDDALKIKGSNSKIVYVPHGTEVVIL